MRDWTDFRNALLRRCIVTLVMVLSGSTITAEFVPLKPSLFAPGNDCRAIPSLATGDLLRFGNLGSHPAILAPPGPDADYTQWLQVLREYRDGIRHGSDARVLLLDYKGVRAWFRLDTKLARELAFQPGERIAWRLEARSVEGNHELCLAFDTHRADGSKEWWTEALSTVEIPADGEWHRVTAEVEVPEFNPNTTWLRPIFGMDATHDPTPGKLEIRAVELATTDERRLSAIRDAEAAPGLELSLYDRPDLEWLSTNFACHFTFLYDLSFYNPERNRFMVEQFLEDGRREFGGYDALLLWHAYPRIGFDERNQFDFYRDMPGGLEGMRRLVHEIQRHGVKVCINYNPWDRATRREPVPTLEALADITAAMDVDGVFLDTLAAGSQELRQLLDARRRGVVLVPELFPAVQDLSSLMGSWYQFGNNPFPEPGLLHHKWIEPRHMHFQISRWKGLRPEERDPHYPEIENAFFNGSGMMIWENIFGTHNPWRVGERMLWSRAVRILRAYGDHFANGDWQPFYPTDRAGLYAHRWSRNGQTVFTLANHGGAFEQEPLLTISTSQGKPRAYDLWRARELPVGQSSDGRYQVTGSVERLGGILITPAPDARLAVLLADQEADNWREIPQVDARNVAKSVAHAEPVLRTVTVPKGERPDGMAYVPGAMLTMHVDHAQREHGCYPDPAVPEKDWIRFFATTSGGEVHHRIGPVQVHPFFIDEAEVSNAEFKEFLAATGYRPRLPENFLKHWPDGRMPEDLADHPVVYLDLDDARAYARWAGKRLPTEEEWHLAAQGTDGRKWPWGNDDPDPSRVNTTGNQTMPVRSCPDGRSPYGCYHMSGNVYEWTESCRSDGHTRFVMIRGGSYFDPKADPETSSIWYPDGGARPCNHHAKFILMYPGLDRCSTIGFRCVKDAQ